MSLMMASGVEEVGDEAQIWRYMGFSKFVSLLATSSLYLPRIDTFEDNLEGVVPDWAQIQYGDSMNQWFQANKNRLFVSCWHLNQTESVLMWKSYSNGEPVVAIESTVGNLKQVLTSLPDAYIFGKVKYVETFPQWQAGTANVAIQAYYKRRFFESEREFRVTMNPFADLALLAEKQNSRGLSIADDLAEMINRIHVASGVAPWFRDTVASVCQHYDLVKEVVPSEI